MDEEPTKRTNFLRQARMRSDFCNEIQLTAEARAQVYKTEAEKSRQHNAALRKLINATKEEHDYLASQIPILETIFQNQLKTVQFNQSESVTATLMIQEEEKRQKVEEEKRKDLVKKYDEYYEGAKAKQLSKSAGYQEIEQKRVELLKIKIDYMMAKQQAKDVEIMIKQRDEIREKIFQQQVVKLAQISEYNELCAKEKELLKKYFELKEQIRCESSQKGKKSEKKEDVVIKSTAEAPTKACEYEELQFLIDSAESIGPFVETLSQNCTPVFNRKKSKIVVLDDQAVTREKTPEKEQKPKERETKLSKLPIRRPSFGMRPLGKSSTFCDLNRSLEALKATPKRQNKEEAMVEPSEVPMTPVKALATTVKTPKTFTNKEHPASMDSRTFLDKSFLAPPPSQENVMEIYTSTQEVENLLVQENQLLVDFSQRSTQRGQENGFDVEEMRNSQELSGVLNQSSLMREPTFEKGIDIPDWCVRSPTFDDDENNCTTEDDNAKSSFSFFGNRGGLFG